MSMVKVMKIDEWLEKKSIEKDAIIFKDQHWTFSHLNKLITKTSLFLQNECQLKVGDRFCYYGTNNPEQIVLLFAASKIGAIMFPINWRLANPEIEYLINHSNPNVIFFDTKFGDKISQIHIPRSIKTIAVDNSEINQKSLEARRLSCNGRIKKTIKNNLPLLLVYTSGTTGKPKGALLGQKAIISNAKMSHDAHSMKSSDKVLISLPLFHVGGINILFLPALLKSATVVLQEKFEPDQALKIIGKYKITKMITVPTILDQMIKSKFWIEANYKYLQVISIGSTNVPKYLLKKLHSINIPIIQIYGATETGPLAIYQKVKDAFITEGSIGKAGSLCKIKLVDEDLNEVSIGQPGQILVKGENILECYWNDEIASQQSIKEGWFLTGDIAKIDEDGNYWFIDRIKNVIISGGENIYPAELELLLLNNKDLVEYSIVGKNDDKWGEVPVIVAVKKNKSVTSDQILHPFNEKVAKYKIPKEVVFVDHLPRNALGKIINDEVKKLLKHH